MIKQQIVDGINNSFDRIKNMGYDELSQETIKIGNQKNVNYMEYIFLQEIGQSTNLDVVYEEKFKNDFSTTQREVLEYSAQLPEDTPFALTLKTPVQNMIVNNPCGSQRWPDILIIKDNVAYPLEIKTCKMNKPKMNSGMFRLNTLYAVVLKDSDIKKRQFRLMFGEEMISFHEIKEDRKFKEEVYKLEQLYKRKHTRFCIDDMFKPEDWFPPNIQHVTGSAISLFLKK